MNVSFGPKINMGKKFFLQQFKPLNFYLKKKKKKKKKIFFFYLPWIRKITKQPLISHLFGNQISVNI